MAQGFGLRLPANSTASNVLRQRFRASGLSIYKLSVELYGPRP